MLKIRFLVSNFLTTKATKAHKEALFVKPRQNV